MTQKKENWIIYLATYPPRECGIATFTKDLTDAIDELIFNKFQSKIVAMNINKVTRYPYPEKVIYQIDQTERKNYSSVAKKLNKREGVKLVVIQHEFGIFGGEYGAYLFDFLKEIKKPVVITFHSVIPSPNPTLQETVKKLAYYSKKIVVMTQLAKKVLLEDYKLRENQVAVIPHGIHPSEFRDSQKEKIALSFDNNIVLSTFGLLSSGKGIEYVLRGLPAVVKEFPNVFYLVIGATHPIVLKNDGEKYRNFLEKEVKRLSLCNNVRFYNKYLGVPDLIRFLQATDIYISSSLDPNQAVSGTFSYALGAGRPVVSTAFSQAQEYINDKVGILVDFKKPSAYSQAIIKLLRDKKTFQKMGKEAYFATRNMTWPNVALSYFRLFQKTIPELSSVKKDLPIIKLNHLAKMTDGFGVLQFAELSEPDVKWGYTLDDNARALTVASQYYELTKEPKALHLVEIYLKFIEYVARKDGHFDNYVDLGRKIDVQKNEMVNLEDAISRTLRSLAWLNSTKCIPDRYRRRAEKLFESSSGTDVMFSSPRAIAFHTQGLYYWWLNHKNPKIVKLINAYCNSLLILFQNNSDEKWQWFEGYLTYSNSILCEALIYGYLVTKNQKYFQAGQQALDFLISQTFLNGIYVPIGQDGWYTKNGERKYFDQQPEEVATMVQTLKEIYKVTKKEKYRDFMYQAFYWFLGDNTLGLTIYDRNTGACYDGLSENHINLNQGAESTVSYLLARLAIENGN